MIIHRFKNIYTMFCLKSFNLVTTCHGKVQGNISLWNDFPENQNMSELFYSPEST